MMESIVGQVARPAQSREIVIAIVGRIVIQVGYPKLDRAPLHSVVQREMGDVNDALAMPG